VLLAVVTAQAESANRGARQPRSEQIGGEANEGAALEDVLGLQIAVDDVVVMQVADGVEDRPEGGSIWCQR
jgi:hypothetical protein